MEAVPAVRAEKARQSPSQGVRLRPEAALPQPAHDHRLHDHPVLRGRRAGGAPCSPRRPTPHDPYHMPHDGWKMDPSPPSAKAPLGTLPPQYDILYGVIWGTRSAFRIGLLVVLANVAIGLVLGAIAGYFGGIVDEIDHADHRHLLRHPVRWSWPWRSSSRWAGGSKSIMLVLIILGWPTYTRVIRSEILVIRNMDYIQAARASGASHLQILFRHILPNSIFSVIIIASMHIGTTVLTAAALSFLGLGAESGYADWGAMVSTCRNWIVGPVGEPPRLLVRRVHPRLRDRPVRAGLEPARRRDPRRVRPQDEEAVAVGRLIETREPVHRLPHLRGGGQGAERRGPRGERGRDLRPRRRVRLRQERDGALDDAHRAVPGHASWTAASSCSSDEEQALEGHRHRSSAARRT